MSETYLESLRRENKDYSLRVQTLENESQTLRIRVEELMGELTAEEHKVNRLLKGGTYGPTG